MGNKKLNMETFNEILFKALKPEAKKSELVEMEIQMAYGQKIQVMEELVDCLNKGKPHKETLKQVNNIDSNLNYLGELLEKTRAEEEQK